MKAKDESPDDRGERVNNTVVGIRDHEKEEPYSSTIEKKQSSKSRSKRLEASSNYFC